MTGQTRWCLAILVGTWLMMSPALAMVWLPVNTLESLVVKSEHVAVAQDVHHRVDRIGRFEQRRRAFDPLAAAVAAGILVPLEGDRLGLLPHRFRQHPVERHGGAAHVTRVNRGLRHLRLRGEG